MRSQKLVRAARIFRAMDRDDRVSFLLKADAPYLIERSSGAKLELLREAIAGLSVTAEAFDDEDRSLACLGFDDAFNLEGILQVGPWPVSPSADLISLDDGSGQPFGNYAIGKSCVLSMSGEFSVLLLESHVNCLNHGHFRFAMDARVFTARLAELAGIRL